jgi:hypothetical protein
MCSTVLSLHDYRYPPPVRIRTRRVALPDSVTGTTTHEREKTDMARTVLQLRAEVQAARDSLAKVLRLARLTELEIYWRRVAKAETVLRLALARLRRVDSPQPRLFDCD